MPLNEQQAAQLAAFGANVRRERMRQEVTQEKLAELVDLNIRTVQKIEAGEVNILLTTVLRIQKALGCPWDVLLNKKLLGIASGQARCPTSPKSEPRSSPRPPTGT